jgi:hypothetical protein
MAGLVRRVGSVRQRSDGNRACLRTPGGVGRAGCEPGQSRALCLTGRRRGGERRPVCSPVVIRVPRDVEHVPARPEAAARVARPPSEAWSTLVRVAELPLRSEAFQRGGDIPRRHSCEGQDVSPALAWSDPPPGTRALELVVDHRMHRSARSPTARLEHRPAGRRAGEGESAPVEGERLRDGGLERSLPAARARLASGSDAVTPPTLMRRAWVARAMATLAT